ncbi:MAG: hypothetical protein PUP93_16385 [Rhizonema sp. NSF051]|nr:hypothetical protein [Rhizonema sp. NSF051]
MENLRRLYYEVFWDNWVLTCPTLAALALLELAFRSDPNGFELMTKRQEQKKTEVAIADALIEWLNSVRKNSSVYISLDKICLSNIKLGSYTDFKLVMTSYNDVWGKVKFFGHLENTFGGIKDRLNYVLVINCKKITTEKIPLFYSQRCKSFRIDNFPTFPTFPISNLL